MVGTRVVGAAVLLVFSAFGGREGAGAHPLHTSITEVTADASGNLAISVRLFADDFGAALTALAGESHSREETARAYFGSTFAIAGKDGKPLTLAWCGMREADGLVWLCARVQAPSVSGLRLRNALMFDRFSDQISIVRVTANHRVQTHVLSARAPVAMLK